MSPSYMAPKAAPYEPFDVCFAYRIYHALAQLKFAKYKNVQKSTILALETATSMDRALDITNIFIKNRDVKSSRFVYLIIAVAQTYAAVSTRRTINIH